MDASGELIYGDAVTSAGPSTGGLITILGRLNANELMSTFFMYERALRAHGIKKSGRNIVLAEDENAVDMTDSAIRTALSMAQKYPEIGVAHRNYQNWNNSIPNLLRESGLITSEMADEWMSRQDYIPLWGDLKKESFDAMGGQFVALGRMLSSLPGERLLGKKDKYDKMDDVEAITKNTLMMVRASLMNIASNKALDEAAELSSFNGVPDYARKIEEGEDRKLANVTTFRDGKEEFWIVEDEALLNTLTGLYATKDSRWATAEKILGKPARLLRETVTRSPEFMLANMMRDSLAVWGQGGDIGTPIASTLKRFTSDLRGDLLVIPGEGSTRDLKVRDVLEATGTIGGYELADIESGRLDRKYAKMVSPNTTNSGLMDAWYKVWDGAGDLSSTSEAATRQLVFQSTYSEVYKDLITGGLSEAEAQRIAIGEGANKARDVLNFNKRGSNPWMQMAAIAYPFMNARIQGMDRLARTGTRGELMGKRVNKSLAMLTIARRAAWMSGATVGYTLLLGEDEDRDKIRPENRDNYWWIPLPGSPLGLNFFAIPIPFEVGLLFKVIPETFIRGARYQITGGDTGMSPREASSSLWHAATETLRLDLMPQLIKPVTEAAWNKSGYTGEAIVPHYMEDLGAEAAHATTSDTLKLLARGTTVLPKFLVGNGISPLAMEHVIRGYTSQLGVYALSAADWGLSATPLVGSKPTPRITDLPFFRRFLADDFESGLASKFYELRDESTALTAIINKVEKYDPQRAAKMRREHRGLEQFKSYKSKVDKALAKIRDEEIQVYAMRDRLSAAQMRERLDRLALAKQRAMRNIFYMEKVLDR